MSNVSCGDLLYCTCVACWTLMDQVCLTNLTIYNVMVLEVSLSNTSLKLNLLSVDFFLHSDSCIQGVLSY